MVARALLPVLVKSGMASAAEVGIDTLLSAFAKMWSARAGLGGAGCHLGLDPALVRAPISASHLPWPTYLAEPLSLAPRAFEA